MADAETPKKRGRPSKRVGNNGEIGSVATGAGTDVSPESETTSGRVFVDWAEFDKFIYKWEFDNKNARITLIYSDLDGAPTHYTGCYSECDVAYGKPGYRLSTGEIVTV